MKEPNPQQMERMVAWVLGRRGWVIGTAMLLTLVMAVGVIFIGITNDYRILFDEGNPQLAALDTLRDTYTTSDRVMIAVAPRDGQVFTREALGAFEELTEAAWRTPYSSRVDSLTNYLHSEAFGDDLVVAPLVEDAHSLSDAELARARAIALGASELTGRMVSHEGHVGGLLINFVLPENHDQAVAEITDYLNVLLDQARARYPGIDFYMTGSIAMNRAFADATRHDLLTLSPIVFLVIVLVAVILLRSLWCTVAIMTMTLFVVGTTMGFAGWLGAVLSPGNAGVPIIVVTVTVAHSIHVVTGVMSAMRRGLDKNAAIVESIRINAYPVFLTSLTTTIGFLSLNAADSPPFRSLGNFVAFGIFWAFVYTMTVLPALLSVFPLHLRAAQAVRRGFFDRLADFVIARRTFLLWFLGLVAVALISGIPRNELTDNWTEYFDERYELRRSTDFVIENLSGVDLLEYSLDAGQADGITDPAYLRTVEAFAEWYREQPEVTNVQAFTDIMKRLNRNMHGDDPAFHRLPDTQELAAQYLLLYELSLPEGTDLNDRINMARSATRMTVMAQDMSTRELRRLDDRAQAWLQANLPGVSSQASGISMIFAYITERNIHSMLKGTIIAMTLISLILVLAFRSVRLGLVSLVPNFIPAAMSFGLWGYLVGYVGLPASIVIAIVLGIVVDDTIHFLSKYLKARREGFLAPEAVRASFNTVGQALWTTTAVLTAGFLGFSTSGFEPSWTLGMLVSITIVFALAADFLLLPTLLIAMDRKRLH
ncbi:MAG: MMPL family transporter [Proteobacteria bacterium]|nr:MMPL family transporter [Pseudomonadota bacterium]